MPCPWEKRLSKRSGGRVSDLSILSSRILKNGRMAKRVQRRDAKNSPKANPEPRPAPHETAEPSIEPGQHLLSTDF